MSTIEKSPAERAVLKGVMKQYYANKRKLIPGYPKSGVANLRSNDITKLPEMLKIAEAIELERAN